MSNTIGYGIVMIEYSDNSGTSIENAIKITGAQTHYDSVMAEYDYIKQQCAATGMAFVIKEQGILNVGSRHYDAVKIELSDDSTKTFFFDITESYDKFIIYPQ
jgi:hypothetical protein